MRFSVNICRAWISLAAATVFAAAGGVALAQAPDAESPDGQATNAGSDGAKPYTVECGHDPEEDMTVCLVDRGTYVGWRTFHAVCHACHAQDAVGSTFAPDLLKRMREIDKAAFLNAMNEGFEGQMGVMPPWKQDPNVNRFYEELWSYLMARADGVLLPGRPKRLPNPQ